MFDETKIRIPIVRFDTFVFDEHSTSGILLTE